MKDHITRTKLQWPSVAPDDIHPRQRFMLNFCFLYKLHLFLFPFVFFFSFHSLAHGNELKEEKRVLVLFPAQSDLPAFPMEEEGIKSIVLRHMHL
jgi:hypothetical protein